MHPVPGPTPSDEQADDARPVELGPLRWSVRRAIELLDEGIDRMGEQLARSAGLYGDSPAEPKARGISGASPGRGRRDPVDDQSLRMERGDVDVPGGPELP
ncbi:MAG: hypothetical protein HOV67_21995 [Kribbellaceae bacterium]|nr:hypothetical protein [Kribbellaceae bacterium]